MRNVRNAVLDWFGRQWYTLKGMSATGRTHLVWNLLFVGYNLTTVLLALFGGLTLWLVPVSTLCLIVHALLLVCVFQVERRRMSEREMIYEQYSFFLEGEK